MTSTPNTSFSPASIGAYFWIFLGALTLRGLYLWEAAVRNEILTYPIVDAGVYVGWAQTILAGNWLWQDAINYTPMIPIWIAGMTVAFGANQLVHFAIFHLLAAAQAVVIGKTAELMWTRHVGIAAGWVAALYWPVIIFEASYFAEPFAIWNLSLAIFLIVFWYRRAASSWWLVWAGFHLGLSVLARANTLLCVPVLAGWVLWIAFHRTPAKSRWLLAALGAVALVLPSILLCAPVMAWNVKLTGRPMLRTQGWVSVYVGNLPETRGTAIPAGVRWWDLMYQPIRAEKITPAEQEDYWKTETLRVVTERTGEWLRLLPRRFMLLIGGYEVSQEIEVHVFRSFSRILSLPWLGWSALASLAVAAAVLMIRNGDARRGLPLALFGLAYLASIAPVQACGRYRLPMLVPLAPLAGFALVRVLESLRRRDRRILIEAVAASGGTALLLAPDWLGLSEEKILNHHLFVGLKRQQAGDVAGAEQAFTAGAAWNPADPDCPIYLGAAALGRGEHDIAAAHYARSLEIFPQGYQATLGLGEVELARGRFPEALACAEKAFQIAPNNQESLKLAIRVHSTTGNWGGLAAACRQARTYPTHPASVAFSEAWAWTLAGLPNKALPLYDLIAQNRWFTSAERSRALFLGAAFCWRMGEVGGAKTRFRILASTPDQFFSAIGKVLSSDNPSGILTAEFPGEVGEQSARHLEYSRWLGTAMAGDQEGARTRLIEFVRRNHSAEKAAGGRDILEIWALEDMNRLPADGNAAPQE